MSSVADDVLPLIRTRTDLHQWSVATAHGAQMHGAADIVEAGRKTRGRGEKVRVSARPFLADGKVGGGDDVADGALGGGVGVSGQ